MPALTRDDRARTCGPGKATCGKCDQKAYLNYCRQCDTFFSDCDCGDKAGHEQHRTYNRSDKYLDIHPCRVYPNGDGWEVRLRLSPAMEVAIEIGVNPKETMFVMRKWLPLGTSVASKQFREARRAVDVADYIAQLLERGDSRRVVENYVEGA